MAVIHIIENDTSVRQALVRLMTSEKLPVQAYASGQDFVTTARPGESDCVVADADAADLSGLDLLRQLHEHNVTAPLILLTRDDNAETRAKARQLGAAGYLLKPVDGQALLDTIRFALDRTGS